MPKQTRKIIPRNFAFSGARFDSAVEGTGPVFLEQLNCEESDSSLLDCHSFTAAEPTTCDHSQDVSVQCTGTHLEWRSINAHFEEYT